MRADIYQIWQILRKYVTCLELRVLALTNEQDAMDGLPETNAIRSLSLRSEIIISLRILSPRRCVQLLIGLIFVFIQDVAQP